MYPSCKIGPAESVKETAVSTTATTDDLAPIVGEESEELRKFSSELFGQAFDLAKPVKGKVSDPILEQDLVEDTLKLRPSPAMVAAQQEKEETSEKQDDPSGGGDSAESQGGAGGGDGSGLSSGDGDLTGAGPQEDPFGVVMALGVLLFALVGIVGTGRWACKAVRRRRQHSPRQEAAVPEEVVVLDLAGLDLYELD